MKTSITMPAFWLYRGLTAKEIGVAVYLLNIYDELENKPADGWFIQMKNGLMKLCGYSDHHSFDKIIDSLVKNGIIEVESGYVKGWGTKEVTRFRLIGTFDESVMVKTTDTVMVETTNTDTNETSNTVMVETTNTEQNTLQSVMVKTTEKYILNNKIDINKEYIDNTEYINYKEDNMNYTDNREIEETYNVHQYYDVERDFDNRSKMILDIMNECTENSSSIKRSNFMNYDNVQDMYYNNQVDIDRTFIEFESDIESANMINYILERIPNNELIHYIKGLYQMYLNECA